jgi:N-methylhydantoinase A
VQLVGWRATVRCKLRDRDLGKIAEKSPYETRIRPSRKAYFNDTGMVDTRVELFETLERDVPLEGPAIIESPLTTVVIEPGAKVVRTGSGSLVITP